jgi:hypothetical protein
MSYSLLESETDLSVRRTKITEVCSKQPPKVNYQEIDTIRFILICFIIWGHCLLGWNTRISSSFTEEVIKTIVIQSGKISTVTFFLISGFLLKSRLEQYTIKSYFKEKFSQIYGPWLLFICLLSVVSVLQLMPLKELLSQGDFKAFVRYNYAVIDGVVLYTAYWFIISYMLGMALIIGCKSYVNRFWFVLLLLSFTGFYAVNLYFEWIEPNHSKAVLSYVLFIWLGLQINTHLDVVKRKLRDTGWAMITSIMVLSFCIACLEGHYLAAHAKIDPFSSNRFSNIIFSTFFFLSLLKLGKIAAINRLNPRKAVYGIYLCHNILIFECSQLIEHFYKQQLLTVNVYALLGLQICFVTFIIASTYLIVIWIAKSRLKWLIGLK